ncbi:MBL fold metallo-hydrolase RNA specificity domain-containing protein [Nitrosomonas sp. Nm33]|uniref:MBL fold metallo-hydrolase RNA specificity domain-containing protein n=1 Tax=Nitrosomonas sp. Nm33 TaxID=133724 RepID=UPI000B82BE88|nr:MBL fold metallo-hydrolase RNA specificity domain-containing protein [Nitrosomonas sp. Nm33]
MAIFKKKRLSGKTKRSNAAHADQAGLLNWLKHFNKAPERIFIVHGKPSNTAALANAIEQKLKWHATVPERLTSILL